MMKLIVSVGKYLFPRYEIVRPDGSVSVTSVTQREVSELCSHMNEVAMFLGKPAYEWRRKR